MDVVDVLEVLVVDVLVVDVDVVEVTVVLLPPNDPLPLLFTFIVPTFAKLVGESHPGVVQYPIHMSPVNGYPTGTFAVGISPAEVFLK